MRFFKIALIGLLLFLSFIHLWQLDTIPKGLYVDESSIGLNAALIAQTGYDEHGKFMPIFFEAFGEYKNPLYIYLTALIFKLADVSVFNLRLTSFIFFALFLTGLYLLVKKIFKNEVVTFYSLLAGGFVPWFFTLSRISFEVISQLTVFVFCLYFVYMAYSRYGKRSFLYAFITGVIMGISVYSYTTARLLSFLMPLTILIVFYKQIKKWLILLLGFLVGIIPYINFYFSDSTRFANRFNEVTYIYNSHLTFGEKIIQFLENYFYYLSPTYLFLKGDSILRHHIGYNGEVYITVGVLSIIGIGWFLIKDRRNRFLLFLLINLLLSPVAAALTTGDSALRSLLVGLYLLLFSIYGLNALVNISNQKYRRSLFIGIFILLAVEIFGYLNYYFVIYPQKSVWDFQSYDFPQSLRLALNQNPTDIVVSSQANRPYAHLAFYTQAMHLKTTTPISVGIPVAQPGRCIIYFPFNETIINEKFYFSQQLGNTINFSRLKCFNTLKGNI